MRSVLSGSCHCGRLSVEFATNLALADVTPRACQCSFCRKHVAAYISDMRGRLTLINCRSEHDIYRQGFEITDFHICRRCGVLVAATWMDRDGSTFGVVNIHSLDKPDGLIITPTRTNFDSESVVSREDRRRQNWTPTSLIGDVS